MSSLRRLWRDYVRRHVPRLALAGLLASIEGAAIGALAWLVRPMFDRIFVAGEAGAIPLIGGLIFAVFAARALAGFGQRLLVVGTGLRVVTDLQRDVAAHLMALDMAFFHANSPGTLIERVRGDAQALQSTASAALITVGREAISTLSLLAVAIAIDWRWALAAFVAVPVVAVPVTLLQRAIRGTALAARESAARLSTRLDEMFHGIRAIKLNRLEARETARFAEETERFRRHMLRAEAGVAANPALVDLVAAAGLLAILVLAGGEVASEDRTVGEFMSFFTAIALLFDPLRRLSNVAGQVAAARASLDRLYGLFDARPGVVPPAEPIAATPGDLVFEDVQFAYDAAPVLRGLTLTARAGETTALVGPSGAGKSTVFSLAARLADPQSGRVTLGGTDLRRIGLEDLRAQFAVVAQEGTLFDDTVRANIALGRPGASGAEVAAAAEAAFVMDFARDLPAGLDTPVGPRGANLSGGQRQRVAIARAMLRDAPILLLDEPTSALDAQSETAVQAALERLAAGRTTLVIAHRLSTIRGADRILVMAEGRAIDQGRHDDLLARGGLYADLHRLQAGAEAPRPGISPSRGPGSP